MSDNSSLNVFAHSKNRKNKYERSGIKEVAEEDDDEHKKDKN